MEEASTRCDSSKTVAQAPDKSLIEWAAAGDTQAYDQLIRRYWRLAYAAALAEVRNRETAEEAAQEGFLKGFEKLHQLRDGSHFAAWVLKIVSRHARRLRKVSRDSPVRFSDLTNESDCESLGVLAGPAASGLHISQRLVSKEEKERLLEAIQRLRPQDRGLVLLRYFEGLSFEEISSKTGKSEGALRVRLHRILDKMKQELRHYFEGM